MLCDREQQSSSAEPPAQKGASGGSRFNIRMRFVTTQKVLVVGLCAQLAVYALFNLGVFVAACRTWADEDEAWHLSSSRSSPSLALGMFMFLQYNHVLNAAVVGIFVPAVMAVVGLCRRKRDSTDALCLYFFRGSSLCFVSLGLALLLLGYPSSRAQTGQVTDADIALGIISSLSLSIGFWTAGVSALFAAPRQINTDVSRDHHG
ncbi:hypothetical protein JDV02_007364 [Purpureocillium takamizusanense]|uniref:Transmembrane protein n=1 Tax=Purpureocillium takamizusanense TaxID=2060973 RepID=A0A9Q8QI47_9HYPO|nr:uncharacterized protein JDV02_007364 [Purpureocillium takamizusanense]UNI21369.1 hypothetical protein JDV02_007364 [Purpureocillium takamizusanense]